jgi:hypothetical protein
MGFAQAVFGGVEGRAMAMERCNSTGQQLIGQLEEERGHSLSRLNRVIYVLRIMASAAAITRGLTKGVHT